jgi:ribonuclease D
VLGIRSSKGYQADDWLRRPLPKAQLEYAAQDIAHLPALERDLRQRAEQLGRAHVINEACRELLFPAPAQPMPLTFESFRNAWQLDGKGQGALRALIDWYNALPADGPPMQSRTLLSIASRLPSNVRDLARIKGVSPSVARASGGEIIALLSEASAASPEGDALEPVDYATFEDYVAEARLLLVRAELCAELSIAPDVALPMALVRRMLQRAKAKGDLAASVVELEGWRDRLLREGFVRHVQRVSRRDASGTH